MLAKYFDDLNIYGIEVSTLTNRQKIELAEWGLLRHANNIPVKDLRVRHFIHGGMYARELTIPKGVALTGAIHPHAHLAIVTKGDISVMSDYGIMRVKAGDIIPVGENTKKFGIAHEETVFITVHATNETDLETIEAASLIDSNLSWIEQLMIMSGDTSWQELQQQQQ